jgi:hypothetical protein
MAVPDIDWQALPADDLNTVLRLGELERQRRSSASAALEGVEKAVQRAKELGVLDEALIIVNEQESITRT